MKVLVTLIAALIITILFFVPDIVLTLTKPVFHKTITLTTFSLVFIFSFFLTVSKSRRAKFITIIILCLFQLISSLYIAYFGSELMPEIIHKFFDDPAEDTWEIAMVFFSSVSMMHIMLYTALKAYSVMLAILYKSPKYTIQVPGATFIMVAILISVPLRAGFHSAPYLFYPDPVKPSLYNVVNSFSLYLRQILSSQKSRQNAFLDYEIVYAEPKAQNIVLIMGESTRDDYMSLFGYNVPTTPLLDKRQGEANFSCTSILSNAVSTATSLQIFFNLMLEPGNFNAVVTKQANLFKLAKKQGYKTVLISAQSSTLLYGVGTEYIDYFISREAISDELFSKKRDLALIDLLDKTNLSNSKNFVVLHLRSQHTPYEDNYAHMKELAIHSDAAISQSDTATANRLRYENSMKFNDLVIDKIIDYTKLKLANSGETVIFFTSDHGELLGEKGLFGHNHLNVDCAKVPLLILGLNTDINKWKLDKAATHYDLGLSIADLMGIKISNPNTKNPKLRYIHGVNIMYPYAYLEFEINDINNLVNITITKRFTTEDTR